MERPQIKKPPYRPEIKIGGPCFYEFTAAHIRTVNSGHVTSVGVGAGYAVGENLNPQLIIINDRTTRISTLVAEAYRRMRAYNIQCLNYDGIKQAYVGHWRSMCENMDPERVEMLEANFVAFSEAVLTKLTELRAMTVGNVKLIR